MKSSPQYRFTIETALYSLAFILALGLRLFYLGAAPLSDHEASFALQAFDLLQVERGASTQPLYVILTGLLFTIFKDSTAAARFFPAVAGSSLVFLPLLFGSLTRSSRELRYAGLILAFGLALDPGLVAISRLAGSPILALAALYLLAGFAWRGSAVGAGIMAGFALLSGPDLVTGVLGLGLAYGLIRLSSPFDIDESLINKTPIFTLSSNRFWRNALLAGASVWIIIGMFWLRLPQGLAGAANLIPTYLEGWTQSPNIPALRLPAAILLYQPLLIVLGLAGIGWAWFQRGEAGRPSRQLSRLSSIWVLAAILPGIIYPARQVYDLVWTLLPLWILSSVLLSQVLPHRLESGLRFPALGMAFVTALFLVLISYNWLRLTRLNAEPVLYAAIIGGLVLMTLIILILVSLGWQWRVSAVGLAWGFTAVASVYMFAVMWGLSQVRTNQPEELWTVGPGTGQVEELKETLEDFSEWQTGLRTEIDITVLLQSPSLRWNLRNFTNVAFTRSLSPDQHPSIIISGLEDVEPRFSTSYRGQELIWTRTLVIPGAFPPDLTAWITERAMQTNSQRIILWVRNDLFPGYSPDNPGEGTDALP